jgi:hypothetical protein
LTAAGGLWNTTHLERKTEVAAPNRRDWLRWQVACGLGCLSAAAVGEERPAVKPRTIDDEILSAAETAPMRLRFRGTTPADAAAWQADFRAILQKLLGAIEPPAQWSEIEESRTEFDDHTRLELLLRAESVPDLPVYLLLPRVSNPGAKSPGMLCLHGHGDYGHHPIVGRTDLPGVQQTIASSNYDYGLQFVRRGYAVAAPCLIPFGRRILHEKYGDDDPCAVTFVRMQAFGQLPIAANLRDCRWALSLLAGRGEVDASRLGCAGLSYGGRMSMLTAAMDQRVQAAVVSGALNLMQERVRGRYSCGSQIIPALMNYGDHPEIGGLIAPRLAIWEVGRRDALIRSPYAEDFRRRLEAVYGAAGESDQLVFDDFDGGHRWNGVAAYPRLEALFKS